MNLKSIFLWLTVVLIGLGTIIPLFNPGFFEYHDNTTVARVYEMTNSLKDGMFPVRWVENLGYGYGYPIFNFYSPLPYYIGGLINLIGFEVLGSTKIMIGIGMVLSSLTMYMLSKRFFGVFGGLLSATIYSYFPYHAANLYVRGAIGEIYAYAFLPLVFLGASLILSSKKAKLAQLDWYAPVILAIGVGFTAISHNLSALMLAIILFPVSATVIFFAKHKGVASILILISLIVGVGLASFYVVPAFMEMKYTNVSSQVGGGADFRDHFVCLGQFWESQWGYGGSTKGCMDGISFGLGKTNIAILLLALIAIGYSAYKRKLGVEEKTSILGLVVLITSLFFTLNASSIFWESIALMEYIQYPWRFINFIALSTAFICGYLAYFVGKKYSSKTSLIISLGLIGIIVLFNFRLFNPQFISSYSKDYFTNRSYITYTVSKISDEYLPPTFDKPRSQQEVPVDKVQLLKGQGEIKILNSKTQYLEVDYSLSSDSVLHINTAYFPAWKAYLNNEEVPIVATSKGMNVSIPKEVGVMTLVFRQTGFEIIGNTLSILALLALLIVIMLKIRYGKKTS